MVNLKMKLENLGTGKIWHQRPEGDPPCSFYFMLKIETVLIFCYLYGLLLPKVNLFFFCLYQFVTVLDENTLKSLKIRRSVSM